jgi:hypothetical protein
MRKLSSEQFSKARDFLLTKARPLDRAMFRFEFEQGSASDVLKELEIFQNEDGGFGNALEPDFRLPDSSAMASTIALPAEVDRDAADGRPGAELPTENV